MEEGDCEKMTEVEAVVVGDRGCEAVGLADP